MTLPRGVIMTPLGCKYDVLPLGLARVNPYKSKSVIRNDKFNLKGDSETQEMYLASCGKSKNSEV